MQFSIIARWLVVVFMVLELYQLPEKVTHVRCSHFWIRLWHSKTHETALQNPGFAFHLGLGFPVPSDTPVTGGR
jgi:hypothetical protein